MRYLSRIFLIITSTIFLFSGIALASASMGKSRLTGEPAPAFSLESTKGGKVSLADLKGKEIILFFFTTWCPYCREKMPVLAEEYRKSGAKPEILPIDVGESKAKVIAFAEKDGLPFPVFLDSDTRVSGAYGLVGVPTVVLISSDGTVAWIGNDLPSDYEKLFKR